MIFTWVFIKKNNGNIYSFLNLRKITIKEILILIGISLLLPAITNFVYELFDFLAVSSSVGEDIMLLPDSSKGFSYGFFVFLYNLFFLAIIPGICEEFLFRGSILGFMKRGKWPYGVAIVVNAILFGAFHENLEQFFYTTAMGIVLTKVTLETNSLYGGIYVHSLYNGLISLPDILDGEAIFLVNKVTDFFDSMNNIFWFFLSIILIWKLIKILENISKERFLIKEEGN